MRFINGGRPAEYIYSAGALKFSLGRVNKGIALSRTDGRSDAKNEFPRLNGRSSGRTYERTSENDGALIAVKASDTNAEERKEEEEEEEEPGLANVSSRKLSMRARSERARQTSYCRNLKFGFYVNALRN